MTTHDDPTLKRLDALVGTWSMKARDLATGTEWEGRDVYEWLDGGFLLNRHEEYGGPSLKGIQVIGRERRWGSHEPSADVTGHWYASGTGDRAEYVWDVGDETLEIRASEAAFSGRFSADRNTVSGRWEWPGGA